MADETPDLHEAYNRPAEEPAPAKSGKMLPLLFLAGGLVLGIGVTFGVVTLLGDDEGGDEAEEASEVEVVEEETLPEFAAEFLEFKRVPVAMIRPDGRLLGYILLDLKLQVEDSASKDWVEARRPIVRDAMLRFIAREKLADPENPMELDLDALPARLKRVVNTALEREIVNEVLVSNAVPMRR